jgi:hypothetical protein
MINHDDLIVCMSVNKDKVCISLLQYKTKKQEHKDKKFWYTQEIVVIYYKHGQQIVITGICIISKLVINYIHVCNSGAGFLPPWKEGMKAR